MKKENVEHNVQWCARVDCVCRVCSTVSHLIGRESFTGTRVEKETESGPKKRKKIQNSKRVREAPNSDLCYKSKTKEIRTMYRNFDSQSEEGGKSLQK